MTVGFRDRREAGQRLAERLREFAGRRDVLVLGLARGGVPVAFEVARALDLPLDVFVVQKLAVPGHPELAMGAMASGGVRVLDARVIGAMDVSAAAVARVTSEEHRALGRRESAYRQFWPTPEVRGRTVILVDDKLTTDGGIFAAVAALRRQAPSAIVVAVPVATPEARAAMRRVTDRCVSVLVPSDLHRVGFGYADLRQTTDDEVRALLAAAARREGTRGPPRGAAPVRERLATPPI